MIYLFPKLYRYSNVDDSFQFVKRIPWFGWYGSYVWVPVKKIFPGIYIHRGTAFLMEEDDFVRI